ncbi:WD40 repeat protein [Giardia muris]|uniref:Cilia- and flagella-associated protein 52 n=1 Tax=Giardia muris TaxID=5742 RepID=A0A4Z1T2C3_GIAMU|nr:WD40 repeat protein [Giardia muris]|eukprot:TNJ26561.1 WD40 repeat protein [Giardia muris]
MPTLGLSSFLGLTTVCDTFLGATFAVHPSGAFVYGAGRLVIVHNSTTNEQRIFPGHTRRINAVAVSPCGRYIATGQDADGPGQSLIRLWTFEDGNSLIIPAFTTGVRHISFSPDSQFIAACSSACGSVGCWAVEDGLLIGRYTAKDATANSFVVFRRVPAAELRPRAPLLFVTGDHNKICKHTLTFNRATLSYDMTSAEVPMPSTGTVRSFVCADVSGAWCFCGTQAGELVVFNLETGVYRTMMKYCKGCLGSILALSAAGPEATDARTLALSSIDGDLLIIYGADAVYNVVSERSLPDGPSITCLSHHENTLFAVVGSGSVLGFPLEGVALGGSLTRTKYDSTYLNKQGNRGELPGQQGFTSFGPHDRQFTCKPLTAAGPNDVRSYALCEPNLVISFPALPLIVSCPLTIDGHDYLVGATAAGTLQVWELAGLGVAQSSLLASAQAISTTVAATAICVGKDLIYVGFNSGYIGCFRFTAGRLEKAFEIPNAHRAAVTCLAVNDSLLVSGGADGGIFAYKPTSGAHLAKVTGSFCKVLSLVLDLVVPTLVHASFSEGFIHTYDFKTETPRRLKNRQLPSGSGGFAHTIAQVPTGRYELVCACVDGCVRFYDFDVADPVQEIYVPQDIFVNHRGRYLLACNANALVSAGCETEGDEVLMTLACEADEWVPADTQLCNGVSVASIWLASDGTRVVITGFDGEVAVYELS